MSSKLEEIRLPLFCFNVTKSHRRKLINLSAEQYKWLSNGNKKIKFNQFCSNLILHLWDYTYDTYDHNDNENKNDDDYEHIVTT